MGQRKEQPSAAKTASLWLTVVGSLFLLALIGSVFTYNLISKYRSEAAILQRQIYEAQNAKQPQPIQVSASDNYFKALTVNAKARPGTMEALALLEKDQFDALQANLLVARAIAPDIDANKVRDWFDQLADQVKQHEAASTRWASSCSIDTANSNATGETVSTSRSPIAFSNS